MRLKLSPEEIVTVERLLALHGGEIETLDSITYEESINLIMYENGVDELEAKFLRGVMVGNESGDIVGDSIVP